MLRLTHVRREVRERPERSDAVARVRIDGIEALVHLDGDQPLGRGGRRRELVVLGERLHRRLRDEHVHAAREARLRDRKVRVVRREDDRDIAWLEGSRRLLVGLRVHLVVRRPRLDGRRLDSGVHVAEHALHVRADRRHLGAIGAAHAELAHLAAPPQVEHHERHDAGRLVGVARALAGETGRVLAGAEHEDAGRWHGGGQCCPATLFTARRAFTPRRWTHV